MLRQCLTNTAHAARGEQEKKHRENEKQADAPNLSAAFALAACDFPAAGRRELLSCRLVFLGGLMFHKTTLLSACYIQFTKKRQIVKK